MNILKNHVIIYDAECPLCNAYTRAFIKTGMLDKEGREEFTSTIDQQWKNIDVTRAKDEIALVNIKDQTVVYGIDSLFKILGQSMPVLTPLFGLSIFRKAMRQLYFFISYNRKVIAPGKQFESATSCTPSVHYGFRWAYIVVAWLITSVTLVFFSRLLVPIIPSTNFVREFLICGGQLVFQGAIVFITKKERAIHYLGNMMTVSLIGGLLLVPAFAMTYFTQSPGIYACYFLIVVGFMLIEHIRRVKILGLPFLVSATWVLYRVIVLGIIMK